MERYVIPHNEYWEIMRRCRQPWVVRKVLSDYNTANSTTWTVEDVELSRERYGNSGTLNKKKAALILACGDNHYGREEWEYRGEDKNGKPRKTIAYSLEHYLSAQDRLMRAMTANCDAWNWRANIDQFYILHVGDPIEGLDVYKNQPWGLMKGMDTWRSQRNGFIEHTAIPMLEWGKEMFGYSEMVMVTDSNHTQISYSTSEYNNVCLDIIDKLKDLGYNIHSRELCPLYTEAIIKGWGFAITHGRHLPKEYQAPLLKKLFELKSLYPHISYVGCGHWHTARNLTYTIEAPDKRQLAFWRTGTPVLFDRHGAKFGMGSHMWYTFICHEDYGIIDHKEFQILPESFFSRSM